MYANIQKSFVNEWKILFATVTVLPSVKYWFMQTCKQSFENGQGHGHYS